MSHRSWRSLELRGFVTERLTAAAEEISALVETTGNEPSLKQFQVTPQIKEEQTLRALVTERLRAAAEEICELLERTIAECEEEHCNKEENQRRQQLLEENQRRQQLLEENQRRQQLLEENQRRQQLLEEDQRRQQLLEENQRRQQLLEEVLRLHTTQKALQEIPDAPHVEVKEEDPDELPVAMETGSESRLDEYMRKYMAAWGGNDAEDEAQTWTASPKSRRDEAKSNRTHFPRIWQFQKHVDTRRGSSRQEVSSHQSRPKKKRTMPPAEERPFPCDACEKTFSTRSGLNVHVKAAHSQTVTPRVCVRNTDRTTYLESLRNAAEQHEKYRVSVRKAAANFGLSNSTLQRFLKQNEDGRANFGYQNCVTGLVFSNDMEKTFAEHIRELDRRFHGLTARKCRALAHEFARRNHLDKTPKGWEENRMAGEEWFEGFKKRHHLTCRKPEASSVAKSLAFNKTAVGEFFRKLKDVHDRHHFSPQDVYNLDETGFTIEQNPGMVVSTPGKKLVGAVTAVCSINASGNALPPFYVFPSVQMKPAFLAGAVPGAAGAASESGWTSEAFSESYLPFFIAQTQCSSERPVLLIMDNHESHISLEAVSVAKASGIVMVTLPPHTSHRLQPLDRTVYGPMKTFFSRATASWMRMNHGRTISIEDMAALSGQAFTSAMTPSNILSGFKSTGICPLNPEEFTEQNFLPADAGDGPTPDYIGDGPMPDDAGDGPTPDDAGDGPTPDDAGDGPTPDDAGDGPTPDDAGDGPTPDYIGDGPTPDDIGDGPTPDDAGDGPTPDDAGDGPTPDDAGDGPTPDDAGDGPTPDDAGDGPTPDYIGDGPTPDDAGDGPTPDDIGDGPTPDDFEDGPRPGDAGDGPTPDDLVHEQVVSDSDSDHLVAVDESHCEPSPTQFVSSSVSDDSMIPSTSTARESTLQNSDPALLWTDSTLHSHWEGWVTSSQ